MKKSLVILFCLVGLAMSRPASAITFQLTSDHCTGGCGTAPYGTVDVTQAGANVDITVHLNTGIFWAKTGAVDFQEFKFNGTGVALGDITVNQTFGGQTLAPQTGAFNGDGTGNFVFGIACTTCGNGNLQPLNSDIVLHIANATIADVTAPNNLGNIFVADIFSLATGNTGPVDVTGPPTVPDGGATVMLLGSALLGLGMLRRRFRKS